MTTSHQKKLKATNQKEAWDGVTTWDDERDICGACSEGKDERRRARYDSCDENGYDSDECTAEEHEANLRMEREEFMREQWIWSLPPAERRRIEREEIREELEGLSDDEYW